MKYCINFEFVREGPHVYTKSTLSYENFLLMFEVNAVLCNCMLPVLSIIHHLCLLPVLSIIHHLCLLPVLSIIHHLCLLPVLSIIHHLCLLPVLSIIHHLCLLPVLSIIHHLCLFSHAWHAVGQFAYSEAPKCPPKDWNCLYGVMSPVLAPECLPNRNTKVFAL